MRGLRLSKVLEGTGPARDPGPWTRQKPLSGFVICLIMKALFSLRCAFTHSERPRRSTSVAERHDTGDAPPCDRESIGVALVLTV
jgi:hypothetical protein